MILLEVLFALSALFLFHAYVGYPAVLWAVTRWKSHEIAKREIFPSVSVIIAARNEADKIRLKIEHTLALVYPQDRLEIVVASDASDDGTDGIVEDYRDRGVTLIRAPQRGGKESVQRLALSMVRGEVVVFTDAATLLEPQTLQLIVQNFADPTVGAVSTEDMIIDAAGRPTGEGLYVRYEMWVRRLESQFHSLVGLSGSCFAIRKALCADWSPVLASDFSAALRAARGGLRAITDPLVRGRFVTVQSSQAEQRRKTRTFLRGITVLMANRDLMNPRHGRFAFQLASHKLLRFCAPMLLLTAFITSVLLSRDPLFLTLAVLQAAFYLVGGLAGLVPAVQQTRGGRLVHFFTMVQWAMLTAWGKYVLGQQQITWEPTRRS